MRLIFILILMISTEANAILLLSPTRIIYSPEKNVSYLHIKNYSEYDVSINAWLTKPGSEEKINDFNIKTNFSVLKHKEKGNIRITQRIKQKKTKVELFYWLNVRESDVNKDKMVVIHRLKFFVRSSYLGAPSYTKKMFTLVKPKGLLSDIRNNTPFFLTLINIKLDNVIVEDAVMLKPYSKFKVIANKNKPPKELNVQVVNDFGLRKPMTFKL